MSLDAPNYVNLILAALRDAGFEAYPVGGCVRDCLLGKTPADWDICTSALPEETAGVFQGFHVIGTGMKHGTVTVVMEGHPTEITTFRTESGYGDNRHPDSVCFVPSLREDLSRRDLTVNAMAFDRDGSVIDLFGGRGDLAGGIIRCVGDPVQRFREDGLRILRALRFASRLGFAPERETAEAILSERELLQNISAERIFAELKGILAGQGAGEMLRTFTPVFFELLPELAPLDGFEQHSPHHVHDIWTHTTMAVDAIEPDPALRLTMLLHDIGKPERFFRDEAGIGHFYGHAETGAGLAETVLRRLRCDNATRQEVTELIRRHDMAPPQSIKGVRRLLTEVGEVHFRRLIACWKADSADRSPEVVARNMGVIGVTEGLLQELLASESCFSLRDLAVNGRDIMALGVPKGPVVGKVLNELFRLVTEENIPNTREGLLELAEVLI